MIQSYKHDGKIHRIWKQSTVLEVTDDMIVVANNRTWVLESDGRRWFTREPAICFFSLHDWHNYIAMIRKQGIFYYCNIASPSIYDGEAIKYIDYDLDIKIFPDGSRIILDEDEFAEHSFAMDYPDDLKEVVEYSLEKLLIQIEDHDFPVDNDKIKAYYEAYQTLRMKR